MSGKDDSEFGFSFDDADDWSDNSESDEDWADDEPEKASIPTEDELEAKRREAAERERKQRELAARQKAQSQASGVRPVQGQRSQVQNSVNRPQGQSGQRPIGQNGQRPVGQSGQRPMGQRPQGNGQQVSGTQRPNSSMAKSTSGKVQQVASKVSAKVDEVTDKASEITKDYSEKLKQEYKADMSTDMKAKGNFGWSLYLYAILAFGFFMFESSTALLLIAGWVILAEKNTKVNKMIISTIVLYVSMKLGWSVFTGCYSLVYNLIPSKIFSLDISIITDVMSTVKKFVNNIYDFAYIVVGLRGLLLAKKGSYFKLKFVEGLFE